MKLAVFKSGQKGASIVEMALVIAVMGFVISAVTKFLGDSKTNLIDFENKTSLTRQTQRISENIRESMKSATMLLADIDRGSYTAVMNYSTMINDAIAASATAPPKVPFSKAPMVFTSAFTITDTAAASYIGNEIQFAAHAATTRVAVTLSGDVHEVKVNLLQLCAIYLAQVPNTRVGPLANSRLALVEWRSLPIPQFDTLDYLDATAGGKRELVTNELIAWGYTHAWNHAYYDGAAETFDSTNAFYELTDLTSVVVPPVLQERSWAYMNDFVRVQDFDTSLTPKGQVAYASHDAGVAGFPSSYSIAYNNEAGTPAAFKVTPPGFKVNVLWADGVNIAVPRFVNPGADGFPGGFEVFLGGQPSARKVWARTTMMAASGASARFDKIANLGFNASYSTVVATVRTDF